MSDELRSTGRVKGTLPLRGLLTPPTPYFVTVTVRPNAFHLASATMFAFVPAILLTSSIC